MHLKYLAAERRLIGQPLEPNGNACLNRLVMQHPPTSPGNHARRGHTAMNVGNHFSDSNHFLEAKLQSETRVTKM
jgi:hypothetical protein